MSIGMGPTIEERALGIAVARRFAAEHDEFVVNEHATIGRRSRVTWFDVAYVACDCDEVIASAEQSAMMIRFVLGVNVTMDENYWCVASDGRYIGLSYSQNDFVGDDLHYFAEQLGIDLDRRLDEILNRVRDPAELDGAVERLALEVERLVAR